MEEPVEDGYRSTTAQMRKRREETCSMVVRRGERTRPSEEFPSGLILGKKRGGGNV